MSERCKGKTQAPHLTDEQRQMGWDICYRRTTDPSGYCFQHRDQQEDADR